jgi:predicted phage terminase large subunit-like protein
MTAATTAESVSPRERAAEILREIQRRKRARENFADYLEYVDGRPLPRHIRFICERLQNVAEGRTKRMMISMPPSHAKSHVTSQHFPAWFLSKWPKRKVIAASATQDLASSFGLKIRNIIKSDEHQRVFPESAVSADKSAADEWNTLEGGGYVARGVGGMVTGRRGDLLIGDDFFPDFEAAESDAYRKKVWSWYNTAFRTRLSSSETPIILIGTRWHLGDHFGKLDQDEHEGTGDKWERVLLPAIAEEDDQLGREVGEALWPELYPIEFLEGIRRSSGTTARMWASLYQQTPIVDEGGIIDKRWFKVWRQPIPPKMEFTLQSWDTALTAGKTSAFSAMTTWGVFRDDSGTPNIILLSAWRGRKEYHEIRKMAQRTAADYLDVKENMPRMAEPLKPDMILVEAKATGDQLIRDLRRGGVMATPFNPDKKGDKVTRVRLITPLIENGLVWVPGQPPLYDDMRPWAQEFVDQCGQFPASDSRDWVDTMTQAFHRVLDSGWVYHGSDPVSAHDEEEAPVRNFYW